jgi:hypothetical protein
MSIKRVLITWFDIHGKAYSRSRKMSLRRLLAAMEAGDL